ncbi:MAG: RIP metalloprotease RseP, partial [Caldilineaceae bacterium]|nr:RIP metalloprotease RseP [Caldilineaceae bacterium]
MESTLITVVSFIVVLGILVFFHELGHYWVARRNGIVVEEFGFGYPPRLLKLFTYDGTDFTLNLLPFGGFARMKGEDAGDMSAGSFNAARRGGRAATLIAGPAMNALLAIVLFAASYSLGFPAPAGFPQLVTVSPAAEQLGLQPGDVVLDLAGTPAQVPAQRDADFTILRPATASGPSEILVGRDGRTVALPVADAGAAWQAITAGEYVPALMTQVTGVVQDSPADAGGIQPGDIVFTVNDSLITYDFPMNRAVSPHLGEPVMLSLWRDGQFVQVTATPRADPPPGEGALGVQITYVTRMGATDFLVGLWRGLLDTLQYALLVLQLPVLLILGQLSPAEAQISGPVGIAQLVGDAVTATIDTGFWFPILRLSAVLSAALAITNLLPLPALDGGRLLFILIETIRGRRVSPEREGLIHMVGFALLLGLMLIIT